MRSFFSKLPIARKILLVVVLTMGSAVALSSIILSYYDSRTQEAVFLNQAKLVSSVVAKSSAAAVAFIDKKRAKESLDALKGVESIQYACLYSLQMNLVLAELIESENLYSCTPYHAAIELRYTNNDLLIHRPITKNDVAIGGLILISTSEELIVRRSNLIFILIISALASCTISLAFTNRLQKLIYIPIQKLNRVARAITSEKDWNLRAEKFSNDELGELVDTFNGMIDQLEQDQKQLSQMAYYDSLTKLPNRRLLEERLSRAIARSKRYQLRYALCFIDLDDFKWVNDTLGHDSGDALLVSLANRVSGVLREEDTLARFGGDEFVIILENFEDEEHIGALCNKVLMKIAEPMRLGDQDYVCGASIGVAIGDPDINSMFTLMKRADIALYQAKNSGKNHYEMYREDSAAPLPPKH